MSATPEQRYDLQVEQIIADIRLKNRQTQTEFWKIGVAMVAAGAVFGGFVVALLGG
jgi:hypothetical protein